MLCFATAQTVASGRGFEACISRENTSPASSSSSTSNSKFGRENNLTAFAYPLSDEEITALAHYLAHL
jgi:hypothetical protein